MHDPEAPPHYDDLFPPQTSHILYSPMGNGIVVPTTTIFPLEFLLCNPPPPYSPESSDSDVPLPDPYAYNADTEWD